MMVSHSPKKRVDDDFLFDDADVRDASAFESRRREKRGVASFLSVVRKVIRRKRFILALALIGLTILMFTLRHHGYLAPAGIVAFLKFHPVVAPVIFIAVYAMMVMCFVPTLPLNLGAGLLWGPYWGGVLTVIGASAGSALAFLAARYLVSDYLNRKFDNSAWAWLRDEIQRKEWQAVAFTRINPIFPFGPSSYFFGLTRIRFDRYLVTTLLSIAPLCILFAAIGSSIGGIILDGDAYRLAKDILAVSLAVTLIVALKMTVKRVMK